MKLDIESFLLLIAVLMSFWKLRKDTASPDTFIDSTKAL